MKTNKKAIFGFASAMILSLGVMQGMSIKNQQTQDQNVQQVSIGCGYAASSTEGGTSGAWGAASNCCTTAGGVFLYVGLVDSWNPLGWVAYAAAGTAAL